MDIRLDGKSAVVTGGSKGLGLAMAQRFAASGADVAIIARAPETLAEAKRQIQANAKGKVATVSADVSKAAGANSAPTSVSRAAQMAFSKVLSGEGAPYNVLVNSLHVGVIVSDQIVRRHRREGANVSLEDFIAQAGRPVPLGRMGRAEEFANIACFLVSDAASYVTGCAINVDGGRSPVV